MMVDQFRLPSGIHGAVIARMMGEENAGDYALALDALALRRGERVLEIGPGAGAHIPAILATGAIYLGVDHSAVSCDMAREHGRVLLGDMRDVLPILPADFDAVLMVNVLQWMPDPVAALVLAKSVLSNSGRLVVSMSSPPIDGLIPSGAYKNYRILELSNLLKRSGYSAITTATAETPRRPYFVVMGFKL